MCTISLNGSWNLYYHLEDGSLPLDIYEVKSSNWPRIDARVPGNIEIDLCNAGIEGDPFYAENLYNFRKYEFYQWWYEREFTVSEDFAGKRLELIINGLDTYGSVWINGITVGETDNMLIGHAIDVTKAVKAGETNHIAIRIRSSINVAREKEFPIQVTGGAVNSDEMARLRKPGHSFGWDIAPRLLSAGIWRDIEIVARENTYIDETYYATRSANEGYAELLIKYRFRTDVPIIEDFIVRVTGKCGEHAFTKEINPIFVSGHMSVGISSPMLWWPKGYGEQNLYDMTLELIYQGKVVDVRKERIGIRVIELVAKFLPGDEGEFRIKVNGTSILAKGSNWVPVDALHSRDKSRLQQAHDLFEDLGCNIVRCWGGNVYEDHDFFDLCDQRGMMVWQDFAMACCIYPQDDDFAKVIEKEAEWVVRKLRNHPSILLWAGDNEVDEAYLWNGYHLTGSRYNRLTREVLPRVVASHDPFRNFLPSSPYIPAEFKSSLSVPEQHNWGPRDYFKGDFYKHTSAHFISEIGYHGCPAVSSLKKFISPEKLWPFSNNEWDTHSTDYIRSLKSYYNRNELMANQVKVLFGSKPENMEEFALASQISQAEAKKFFIEMVRLKKWRRTGLIWWNALDCWPQISDAVVDYYFNKKIAYYYIKRVQNPICIMIDEASNWNHRVVVGNDSRQDAKVKYSVEDGETGEVLLSGECRSKANENTEIGSVPMTGVNRFYLIKWEINGIQYGNHYISGYVPMDFEKYRLWLGKIKALPQPFDVEKCYK